MKSAKSVGVGVGAAALILALGLAGGGRVQTSSRPGVHPTSRAVTVAADGNSGKTNLAIQRAIDEVASAGGGVVTIPPGTWMMGDAVHLRSNVRVVGQEGAVLKKVPSVSSSMPDFLGYGHYEFTATQPEKFHVGMGVHILDDNAMGFYTTVATITGRKGELFFIDRMLNHDYLPSANGRVVSAFSLVEGTNVQDVAVENLVLDGNWPAETFRLNGCRGGGLFLIGCQRVRVAGVQVRQYNGDAVSFQQCADVLVQDCWIHHNAGHGLHPGSGTVRYVMRRVRSHDNGECGLFYCLRTSHSILENCDLHDNGDAGISVGERDSDHLIRNNRIARNAAAAVVFREVVHRGGDRVRIEANTFNGNGTKAELDRCEIFIPAGLHDVCIQGNRLEPATGAKALRVAAGCTGVSFAGNKVAGKPQTAEQVDAPRGLVSFQPPQRFPDVGPAALPPDGALHLGWAKLPPWTEPAGPSAR